MTIPTQYPGYSSKPGPKGPRLVLPVPYVERYRVLQYLSASRRQLVSAYISGKPKRIATAKRRMAKLIREIADNPDLGPTIPFRWGDRLEALIRAQIDPAMPVSILHETNWYSIANELESQALVYFDSLEEAPQ